MRVVILFLVLSGNVFAVEPPTVYLFRKEVMKIWGKYQPTEGQSSLEVLKATGKGNCVALAKLFQECAKRSNERIEFLSLVGDLPHRVSILLCGGRVWLQTNEHVAHFASEKEALDWAGNPEWNLNPKGTVYTIRRRWKP